MRKFSLLFIGVFLLLPHESYAGERCFLSGYTIATVNGVFTDERGARNNMEKLKNVFGVVMNGQNVDYEYLLNPSHLGGVGDLLASAYQKYFEEGTVSDYDLLEMQKAASGKVTTRRLLLVAHSQGNFYANSFYDTISDKVPSGSVGVYAVATPASRVAGDGNWLTSSTDKVIAGLVGHLPGRSIMKPNTTIIFQPGDDKLGHSFSDIYLKYRGAEIVSDIQSSLDKLRADTSDTSGPCITPPIFTIAHRLGGLALAVADPLANAGSKVVTSVVGGTYVVASTLVRAVDIGARAAVSSLASTADSFNNQLASMPRSSLVASANPLATAELVAQEEARTPVTPEVKTEDPQLSAESYVVETVVESSTSTMPLALENIGSSSAPVFPSASNFYQFIPILEPYPVPISAGFGGSGPVAVISPNANSFPTTDAILTEAPTTTETAGNLSTEGLLTATSSISIISESVISLLPDLVDLISLAEATSTATSSVILDPVSSSSVDIIDPASLAANPPVVINEIAWGGTSSNSDDEWIELYNRSSRDIDLSGFTLYSKTDGSPYLNLSGIISAHDYFLIEAKNTAETDEGNESSVKNIPADMWASFGSRLVNTGENLVLSYASTTIDEIPFCFNWCGVPSSRTTERYDPEGPGSGPLNWAANNAIITNGLNSAGNLIFGTPRARNSLNYLINRGSTITSDLTLTKANSPYLINDTAQRVNQGATLTIEPGVVIKFRNASWLLADGNIVADGTPDDPIVFTSFADDTYGGDMDGVTTAPFRGSWFGVELSNKSATSSFDHIIFRYGGNYGAGAIYRRAMLYVAETSPSITNSIFEYSKAYGVYMDHASSTISNSIFRDNIGDTTSTGIYVNQGAPVISGNIFTGNKVGLSTNASNVVIADNNFSGNTNAVLIGGSIGSITGNSGSPGDTINLTGSISIAFATTTLAANPMPYFLSGTVTVAASSTLDIKEGTVIQGSTVGSPSALSVFGKLNIETGTTTGVIFSSNESAPRRGAWIGIIMNPGSSSNIKGATIRDAQIGIKYNGSPISLEDVIFSINSTGVQAVTSPVIKATNVIFNNNGTNKSPSNLW